MSEVLRPILFLDFDDVLCLNAPYGGYDAKLALAATSHSIGSATELWSKLFDTNAKLNLRAIDEKFSPWYVLSTSWTWLFDKEELINVLQLCGLDFVAHNLHATWTTPKQARSGMRADEVKSWLTLHPECTNAWAVLDDKLSGTGFRNWSTEASSNVVLCQIDVGFQGPEFARLKAALNRRLKQH